ncbi:hypothetical protein RF55_10418 [Lasius niger]|uniref:Integrase catalytic domain-containing protein n=1 Tax=Lasius niger TaxID=67767 RepID=A0A0J7KI21_LASNI|nr:hypothetical protein RF55_10418 [Lasius niger]
MGLIIVVIKILVIICDVASFGCVFPHRVAPEKKKTTKLEGRQRRTSRVTTQLVTSSATCPCRFGGHLGGATSNKGGDVVGVKRPSTAEFSLTVGGQTVWRPLNSKVREPITVFKVIHVIDRPVTTAPAGILHATNVQRPWEHVTVDLVGPLSRSRQGHTWLFVMQDRFTKWIELAPLRQATAKNTTKAITERVILRHGRPDVVLSDNETQFTFTAFTERLQEFGIKHRTAPVYAPQCNPVERTNRTVKTMISQFVEDDHRAWDDHLPALQFAFNTAVHDATGYSPAYLDHGRELTAPHPAKIPLAAADEPSETFRRLQEAYELVRINLARAFQRQEKYYNLRRRAWRPQVGDWVWRRDHPLSKKADDFNAKLAPKFIGPLEVRRVISPVIVDLRSKHGKWYRHTHVQHLKPVRGKENKNIDDQDEDEPPHDNTDNENNGEN